MRKYNIEAFGKFVTFWLNLLQIKVRQDKTRQDKTRLV